MENEKDILKDYSRFLDSQGEHLTFAALSTYINFIDELSEKEKKFLRNHLDACGACTARLREVEEVESANVLVLPKARRGIASPAFRYSIAATLILAVGTAVALLVLGDHHEEQLGLIVWTAPERFTPNPILDGFIDRTVRSAGNVKFLSPVTGDTVRTPLLVRWIDGRAKFNVIIVDNKNREVWRDSTSGNQSTISPLLEPGLYYVKLEVNNALAQVCRVVVLQGP